MRLKSGFILLIVFVLTFSSNAQTKEEAYKTALDSLDYYLHFFQQEGYDNVPHRPLRIVSAYKPVIINEHLEDTSAAYYLNRSKGRKDCIFLFDERNFLVLYLKDIDTSYIQPWARDGIRIADPTKKEKKRKRLLYCNIVRESNARGGMFIEEYLIVPIEKNDTHEQKLIYYFKEVVLLSRRVKD